MIPYKFDSALQEHRRLFPFVPLFPVRSLPFRFTIGENLCVVALTSIERGTQFFLLASYFLV